jgi:hypothetical protein
MVLNKDHIDLVCKKDRRQAVKDFVDLKVKVKQDIKNIERQIVDMLPSPFITSDVFQISYNTPTSGRYDHRNIGYMTLNDRVVSKDNIHVHITDEHGLLTSNQSYATSVSPNLNDNSSKSTFVIDITTKEPNYNESHELIDERTYKILSIHFGRAWRDKCGIVVKSADTDVKITNINEIIRTFIDEYNNVLTTMNDGLETLKQKYSSEFAMYEICYGSTAI